MQSELTAAKYMMQFNHAKVSHIVQDPKNAPDRVGKTSLSYKHQENILLLGPQHIGDSMIAYNMDLIKGYDHSVCHGQETWATLVNVAMEAMSESFKAYAAELANVDGLYKARARFMKNLGKL